MAKRKSRILLRSGSEVDGLREAGFLAADVLRQCGELVKPGVSTLEIDQAARDFIADHGCKSAFLGYHGFPGQICISLNEEVVHGIGSSERVMSEGDIVKIDVGIKTTSGWIGDNAKSFPVGQISEDAERLLAATEESLYQAISHAVAGKELSALCHSVEACVTPLGYTVVKEFVGHGVGRDLHEPPQIPNYWNPAEMNGRGMRNIKLQAGMVLAIEPMVNAGTEKIQILKDGWTVITLDKALSSHFEHTVLVTDGEPEILTPRPRAYSPA